VELKPGADVDTLPRNVRGLVISRVDRLSSDAREVLRVGAVFGESFTQPEISFASHIQYEHIVANTLADLTDLQILEDQENGDYRFKHGVMQQALYEELTRQQRQDIHQKIADYFAQQEDSDQQILNHIFHLIKAGHQTQAVTLVLASAQQAEAHNDIDQALELYTRALELLPNENRIKEELERLQGLQEE
jgi:predicted ATPase